MSNFKITKVKGGHWSENLDNFRFFIASELMLTIDERLEELNLTRRDLAKKLGVAESAVSQRFSNPNNMSLKLMIEYLRALGMKLSLIAYDDGDYDNIKGPIPADIFTNIWEILGKPEDGLDLMSIKEICGKCSER